MQVFKTPTAVYPQTNNTQIPVCERNNSAVFLIISFAPTVYVKKTSVISCLSK